MYHRRASESVRTRARELRREMTSAERLLWMRLRNRKLAGLKFRRQSPIGRYIADFECAGCGVIIEIDGDSHRNRAREDYERSEWLRAQGLRVIRFTNTEVLSELDRVLEVIVRACRGNGTTTLANVPVTQVRSEVPTSCYDGQERTNRSLARRIGESRQANSLSRVRERAGVRALPRGGNPPMPDPSPKMGEGRRADD